MDAKGGSVNAGVAESFEFPPFYAGWVGLQGDLEIIGGVEQAAGVGDQVRDGGRVHQGGGAATEEYGG